jgi:lysophospholipase L1-like esterase
MNYFLAASVLCSLLSPAFNARGQQAQPAIWTGSWAAAQQIPEQHNLAPAGSLDHAELRQIIHLSLGGDALRIHVSNAFGNQPLHLAKVHVALPVSAASSSIVPATDRAVLFDGAPELIIPAGAEYISDKVDMPVAGLSDLAVTIETTDAPQGQTGHPGSRATSYLTHNVSVSAATLPDAQTIDHWYVLSAVDVSSSPQSSAIVAFGDSITDGHGVSTNSNNRWPDQLARRLQGHHLAVLNMGIGGNHLLTDGLGPNALARFDRDVLAPADARYVIVLEGVNDLGGATINGEITSEAHDALVARIVGAYEQMIKRAHARGLVIYGGTITPYVGSDYYHPGPASEADRIKINTWIRTSGHFDGYIDFAAAVADPAHPDHLLARFDSGDHLHPSEAGYAAMAAAVPLTFFSAGTGQRSLPYAVWRQ